MLFVKFYQWPQMQCIAFKSLCGGIAIIKKSHIGPQPQKIGKKCFIALFGSKFAFSAV